MKKKTNYSHCEIFGAEVVLQKAYEEEYGIEESVEMYVCDGNIYYADESWGKDLYFDEERISYFTILQNGMLVAVSENDILFRVEPTNITQLNITLEEIQ